MTLGSTPGPGLDPFYYLVHTNKTKSPKKIIRLSLFWRVVTPVSLCSLPLLELHGALPVLTPIPIIEPTYFLFPFLFLPKHPTSSLSLFHPKRPVCFCFAQNRTKPPVIRAASRPNSLSFLIPSVETIAGVDWGSFWILAAYNLFSCYLDRFLQR